MDQNENTTERNPGQAQSPGPQDSASQAEEPGSIQAESPRKCKICGGPNHYGCGCEAKARLEQEVAGLGKDLEDLAGQPESETPAAEPATESGPPAEKEQEFHKVIEDILKRCTPEEVKKILEGELDFARYIKTMADGFEQLCVCFFDTNNYLKLIAGDLITIRKILSKETETEKKDAAENKD